MSNTLTYEERLNRAKSLLNEADYILIGAGSGLSTAAGFTYSGARFDQYFSDFRDNYGFTDMYSGGFYPFKTLEEFWGYWSRYVYINRYEKGANPLYENLLNLVKNKPFFVLTTNVDHQFQLASFPKDKLFYTQGDYGLFQCSLPCHHQTYDNKEMILEMLKSQKNRHIPTSLIPYCPRCGRPMSMNLRADDTFVEDEGWHKHAELCQKFLKEMKGHRCVLLEIGVGFNTPGIIRFPFEQMVQANPNFTLIRLNKDNLECYYPIENKIIGFTEDIEDIINHLAKEL